MKAIVGNPQLGNKLKSGIHFVFCPLYGIAVGVPGKTFGARAKRIRTGSAERMPVSHGKTKMLLHGFSCHYPLLIVPFIRKRVIGLGAFEFNPSDTRKIFPVAKGYTHDFFIIRLYKNMAAKDSANGNLKI
jgi:hypothetical protein